MYRYGFPIVLCLLLVACDRGSPSSPSPDCSKLAVTPVTQTFPGGGGAGTIAVASPAGCSWNATVTGSWVSLTSPSAGSGAGTLTFAVLANPLLAARTAAIRVGTAEAVVSQDGTPNDPSCRFELRPASRAMPAAGGNFLVQVFTPYGCRWTFASGPPWLQVVPEGEGAPNGNGNGSVEAHIMANPDAGPRTGQAMIADQWLTIVQDGQAAAACSYSIAPPSRSVSAAGAEGSVTVSTAAGCSWWIEAEQGSVAWITINSGQRGAGPATIPYTIQPNLSFTSRSANVVVHGDSGQARLVQTVTQAGAGCLYTISPTQVTHDWTGNDDSGRAPFTAQVTTQPADCVWTASTSAPAWISVSDSPHQGRGTVSYRLSGNGTTSSRTGEIVVSGLSGLNPPARLHVTQTAR